MSIPERSTSGEKTVCIGHYSVKDLLGGTLLDRADIKRRDLYEKLGDSKLTIFQTDCKDGKTQYRIEGFPVTGMELNALLHFAAPSHLYGIDTNDLMMDWIDLYSPENAQLLELHAKYYVGPENWSRFEQVRLHVWSLISRDYQHGKISGSKQTDTITPVVIIEKRRDGSLHWVFDEPCEDTVNGSILGPTLIAAFSPDISTRWPKRIGQDMGTTQALPLTLMKQNDLLASELVTAILQQSQSGQERPDAWLDSVSL